MIDAVRPWSCHGQVATKGRPLTPQQAWESIVEDEKNSGLFKTLHRVKKYLRL